MHFYTIKDAAAAIAASLHSADRSDEGAAPRLRAEHGYLAALQNAICKNEIVYRDPVSRLPIKKDDIAAFMTSSWCVISLADLNAWLDHIGVGVRVDFRNNEQVTAERVQAGSPTSKSLAATLAPYLSGDRDEDWLMRILGDVRNRPKLARYRTIVPGSRAALWNPGGVVLHLIEGGYLTLQSGRDALTSHFPSHVHLLENCQESASPKITSSWHP